MKVSENCEYFFQVHFWQMRRTCSIGCESIFRFLNFLFINIESVRSKFAEILRQQRTIERTRICANMYVQYASTYNNLMFAEKNRYSDNNKSLASRVSAK